MNRINYNIKMNEIIAGFNDEKTSILLHSCCGPCSSAVLERIKDYFDITVVYYNPNIFPQEEYIHRKNEQIRLLEILKIKFLDCDYDHNDFLCCIKGLEDEPEGGARCPVCFRLRLEKTAKLAQGKFDYFGTTLSVSPHKDVYLINQIGKSLEEKYGVKFLYADFKKENGFLKSINLSKKYELYRQDYCGCEYSLKATKK